jgi:hypothetical protein
LSQGLLNIDVHDASIVEDPHMPRRDPRQPKRLIEEENIVAYALCVTDEIEHNAFQCRVLRLLILVIAVSI